jgi:hypothetical protein
MCDSNSQLQCVVPNRSVFSTLESCRDKVYLQNMLGPRNTIRAGRALAISLFLSYDLDDVDSSKKRA